MEMINILPVFLQYIEKRTRSGDAVVTGVEELGQGLGFCPDFTPDKTVGVATERLLVGSQDVHVAHDCARLKELWVTHMLNVAYGVPNAFTDVSLIVIEQFMQTPLIVYAYV